MKLCFASLVLALSISACGQRAEETPLQTQPDLAPVVSASVDPSWLSGKQAYEQICASCHEEGLDGAPKTGDREAWDKRSRLWEAVLSEHAKIGYGEMPAKGGDATLDDGTVTRAAEYMLTLTYPETHRD